MQPDTPQTESNSTLRRIGTFGAIAIMGLIIVTVLHQGCVEKTPVPVSGVVKVDPAMNWVNASNFDCRARQYALCIADADKALALRPNLDFALNNKAFAEGCSARAELSPEQQSDAWKHAAQDINRASVAAKDKPDMLRLVRANKTWIDLKNREMLCGK